MSDLKKQIEDAARQYANKTQFMSNYPHDWNSSYDGYIQGAMDVLQPKQANGVSDNHEKALHKHIVSNNEVALTAFYNWLTDGNDREGAAEKVKQYMDDKAVYDC